MLTGNEFQTLGAENRKARDPVLHFDKDGNISEITVGVVVGTVEYVSLIRQLMNIRSAFECLFRNLGEFVSQECRCAEYSGAVGSDEKSRVDTAYRIVADHARMMTIAITDGLVPSRRESG